MNNCKLKIKSENKGANIGSNRINNLIQNKQTRCNINNCNIDLSNNIIEKCENNMNEKCEKLK